jgi:hypothetical protein
MGDGITADTAVTIGLATAKSDFSTRGPRGAPDSLQVWVLLLFVCGSLTQPCSRETKRFFSSWMYLSDERPVCS